MTISAHISRIERFYGLVPGDLSRRRRFEPLATCRAVTMLVLSSLGFDFDAVASNMGLMSGCSVRSMLPGIKSRGSDDPEFRADALFLQGVGPAPPFNCRQLFFQRKEKSRAERLQENRRLSAAMSMPRRSGVPDPDRCSLRENNADKWYGPTLPVWRENNVPGWGSLLFLEKQLQGVAR